MKKTLTYEKCDTYNRSRKFSSTSIIDMSRSNGKGSVVTRSVDINQEGKKNCTKEVVFGRQFFSHSNEVILRLGFKQHLSLHYISPLGDPLSKYTYKFSLLKIVSFPSL